MVVEGEPVAEQNPSLVSNKSTPSAKDEKNGWLKVVTCTHANFEQMDTIS